MKTEKKIKGLSAEQISELRRLFGPNTIPSENKISILVILLRQFANPLVIVLLFVALVSILFYEYVDALLVLTVVVINSGLGFYQEFKAQKTLEKLQQMIKPLCFVIRDGLRKEIGAEELVPGDVVVLGAGDKIPADGTLLSGKLLLNEAILTGESEPVEKNPEDSAFMGTIVLSGSSLMVVSTIGSKTELGKIGVSLREIKKEDTPLQSKLKKLSKQLALLTLITCLFIFVFGVIFQSRDFWEMFRISIILAAAAIPEGLPMATTIIMALGMKRILEKKGLVKRLMSIETLGSTSVICTDKTGTLTEGKMRVVETDFTDKKAVTMTMILNNNQRSGLEIALWEYVKDREDIDPQEVFEDTERLNHHSFDSSKKYSWTEVTIEGKNKGLMMGAPDIIMNFCDLKSKEREDLDHKMQIYAGKGYRLLGFCYKEKGELSKKEKYQWAGMIAIDDPVRAEVLESLKKAVNAGIKVKVVSGDYLKTAEAVARKVGLEVGPENVLEGWELDNLTIAELASKIENIVVFARVSPAHKLKIVEALKLNGEIVAMTGDGVNDAPALKRADIGIAMNDGTEVAKETADLILMDNSFKIIVAAIEEGRVVFANTKKVIAYVLSNSFAAIILIFLSMIFDLPAPLTILQILWLHIICDGPPDLMLGFEPKESGVWDKKPKHLREEQIFDFKVKFLIFVISLTTGVFSFFLFWAFLAKTGNLGLSQTVVFTVLSVASLIYIFSFKNLSKNIFRVKIFDNKPLNFSVLYGFLLVLIAIYLPPLNKALGLTSIGFLEWLYILLYSFSLVLVIEIFLYWDRTLKRKRRKSLV